MLELHKSKPSNSSLFPQKYFQCWNYIKSKPSTVKPLIFACLLFREFCDLYQIRKLKGLQIFMALGKSFIFIFEKLKYIHY